jgi:acetyltransferase-like isoleucine patch superfamily enzyme
MKIIKQITKNLPVINNYVKFCESLTSKVTFVEWLSFYFRKRKDKRRYWPVHKTSIVTHPENIFCGINTNPGTLGGCYIQGNGKVFIGDYVHFARNIGVISGNHSLYNHLKHDNKETIIGDYSWIGLNSVILPGVVLGKRTIVGAGSVVTKSFPDGYCVIAGNPAKLIKTFDKDKFNPHYFKSEYYGYVPADKFGTFRDKYLKKIDFDVDMSTITNNPFYQKVKK